MMTIRDSTQACRRWDSGATPGPDDSIVAIADISLVTAVFNGEETIPDTFRSVRQQAGVSLEYIVVDGQSTDRTLDRIRAAGNLVSRWVSEPDQGIYDALNKGFASVQAPVIGLLHSDDLLADKQVLARVVAAFADPAVDVVYGDLQYVSRADTSRVIRDWKAGPFSRDRLRWGWMPPHPTVFMRRVLWHRIGPYDTRYRIAADYEHMLRFLTDPGVRVEYLPEVLVKMRVGGTSNRSVANLLRKSQEDLRAMHRFGVGGIGSLLAKNLRKVPQFF